MDPLRKEDVYDDQSSDVPSRPHLKALEGGGETTERKKGHLRTVGDGDKSSSPDQLKAKEEGGSQASDNQIGEGFKNIPNDPRSRLLFKYLTRKKALLGGGVAAGIISFFVFAFLSLLPLKIIHIIENLQNRFFATSQNAIEKETSNLLSKYLKINARECKGSVIKAGCQPSYLASGNSPINNLYKVWHQNKLENTLQDKYGISIQYDQKKNTYFLHAPGLSAAGEDVKSFIGDDGNLFVEVGKPQVRQAIDDAMSKETKWKAMLDRFKFGRFAEEKYGVKRCVTALGCKATEKIETITDTLKKPKRAAEVYLTERVLLPRSQILGTAFLCILGKQDCNPAKAKSEPCVTGESCELNGEAETAGETEVRTKLDQLVAKYLTDDAYQIYQQAADDGLGAFFVKQLVTTLVAQGGGDAAAQAAAEKSVDKAIPIVGWVNLAAQIIGGMQKLGPAVKAMRYALSAASMVSFYMMYRSYAAQEKSGHVDPTEAGSFNDSLGPGYHNTDALNAKGVDPNQVGGTAGAEGSPIYGTLINGDSPSTATSLLNNFFPSTAYAASSFTGDASVSSDYKCSSGSTPAPGTVCSEEKIDGGNNILNTISHQFNSGDLSILGTIAKVWNSTIGKGLGLFSGIVGKVFGLVPGVKQEEAFVGSLVGKIAQPVLSWFTNFLIPNPWGTDMSGARSFDMLAGGADVGGNDYAHHGLGGEVLTQQQAAAIVNQQNDQAKYEFQQEPFFARMFDTSNQFSLVSKLAMAIPTDKSSSITSFFGSMADPFGKLINGFASFFSGGNTFAASATADPFGVTQYGYPDDQIPADPQTYWNQNCQNNNLTDQWNAAATHNINSDNGQPENNSTDPCLLIQATIGSAGGYYSDSVLTPDDLADSGGGGAPTPATGNIYVIGDSLTEGMKTSGSLSQKLTSAGLTPTQIEDTVGINVANSIPKLQADASQVVAANTIVVELGTNNCSLGGAPSCMATPAFETQISNMVSAIRAINPTAQIYWMNMYTTKGNVYQSINQAIAAESTPLKYKVIDWAGEVTSNPSKYSFDNQLGVHQTSGSGYSNMASFLVGALH